MIQSCAVNRRRATYRKRLKIIEPCELLERRVRNPNVVQRQLLNRLDAADCRSTAIGYREATRQESADFHAAKVCYSRVVNGAIVNRKFLKPIKFLQGC